MQSFHWTFRCERVVDIAYLLLGGYNSPNAARAWTYLTSIAVGPLPLIPGLISDVRIHGYSLTGHCH